MRFAYNDCGGILSNLEPLQFIEILPVAVSNVDAKIAESTNIVALLIK